MATVPKPEFHELPEKKEDSAGSVRMRSPADTSRLQMVAAQRVLWENRRLLFRLSVAGFVLFTTIAMLIPKSYQSQAQLMPPDDQSNSGLAMASALASKMNGTFGGVAGGLLGMKSSGDLFMGILASRTVQDGLIAKFNLRRQYGQRTWQGARRNLALNTTISENRKSGIITIGVSDRDPQRAAAMTQEYVAELNSVVSQLSTSSARRERIFLEGRLAQVRQDLEEAEKNFSEFSSKNVTVDIKEQGRAMVGAAATLEGQLIAAQSELQGFKQIYSDTNVKVRALTARIAELQSQRAQMNGQEDIVDDATRPGATDIYPSLRKLPLLGVAYADLYRRSRVQEAVFETLTQEFEMAKVSEAKEIPSVRVLDAPDVPEIKSFPPVTVIAVVGTFFTFLLSAFALLVKARWNAVRADDPQKVFMLEVARTIEPHMPWASPNGSRFQTATHRLWWLLVLISNRSQTGRREYAANPAGTLPEGSHSASPFDSQL